MQQRDAFNEQVVGILPRLRVRAAALTRNRAAADDLVQETVMKALAARESFAAGSNFRAWMQRILYNHFISTVRKQRELPDPAGLLAAGLTSHGQHENRLILKELRAAILRLPRDQRAALLMVALDGMSYEEVSEATGWAIGTCKSRVFRARRQLERWLAGEDRSEPDRMPPRPVERPRAEVNTGP